MNTAGSIFLTSANTVPISGSAAPVRRGSENHALNATTARKNTSEIFRSFSYWISSWSSTAPAPNIATGTSGRYVRGGPPLVNMAEISTIRTVPRHSRKILAEAIRRKQISPASRTSTGQSSPVCHSVWPQ